MATLKTVSTATVRAQDVKPLDIIRFAEDAVYYQRGRANSQDTWLLVDRYDTRLRGWQFVYDVDNGDGGEEGAQLYDNLHEQFVLYRIAIDDPNATENDDRYIAIGRTQLVSVQAPDTED